APGSALAVRRGGARRRAVVSRERGASRSPAVARAVGGERRRATRKARQPLVLGDSGVCGLPAGSEVERRLGAVLDAELGEEVLHVKLHGVVGGPEAVGGARVGGAGGDERASV